MIFWSKNKLLSHFIGVPYDGEKADVWSMGVVLYTMVTGRMPFDDSDMKMLVQQIKRGVTFHNPKQPVSESCKDLIRNMLKLDFKTRLSVEEIEAHPWLTNVSLSREERAMSETTRACGEFFISKQDFELIRGVHMLIGRAP